MGDIKKIMISNTRGRGGLVNRVAEALRERITSGSFEIGDKISSQADLAQEFSVSRTVIREAVVRLQADGLVEAHQGAGIFVIARNGHSSAVPQTIDKDRVFSILEVLELRTAVEVEAAGLAAVRRSPAQEEAILAAHKAFAEQIAGGEASADADFLFHRAVAGATNNPRFVEVLDLWGRSAIPRTYLNTDGEFDSRQYLELIVEEHKAIVEAIAARDDSAAMEAMRLHLKGSQKRYRTLLSR